MNSIQLSSCKVLFLGYGAVAKCTWNYFDEYFNISPNQVYLVDKTESAFYGPKLEHTHKIVKNVDATNFNELVEMVNLVEGDIIIDLTFSTCSYFFISMCLLKGFHYINTSIEDKDDLFNGSSIDYQQQRVKSIYEKNKKFSPIRSCILTECGQNPGLIQHYVLYALNRLYALHNPSDPNRDIEFRREVLTSMIHEYQIGSILMSERDEIRTNRVMNPDCIYNTWSVGGFISEAFDPTELVRGTKNSYIQPNLSEHINHELTTMYHPYQNNGKEVLFMKQSGLHSTLPSMAPILVNNIVTYETFRGQLIHHGEIFELANYFGEMAPFMSYVYQSSPYINQSIKCIQEKNNYTRDEMISYISDPTHFSVMDNINMSEENHTKGYDSIGATFLCGTDKITRMFWCGSIVSDSDVKNPLFTPTIVQVAAGVLSGLSYILEKDRIPGLYEPIDLDTTYMLTKAKPLLGKFFFDEIKVPFNTDYTYV
jgi:homospermidine synthase